MVGKVWREQGQTNRHKKDVSACTIQGRLEHISRFSGLVAYQA